MGVIAAKIYLNSLKYYFYYIWSKITTSFYYVFDLKNTWTQSNLKTAELNKEEIKQIVEEILDIARKDLVYTKIKAPTNKERDKKKYYHKKCKSNIQNSF